MKQIITCLLFSLAFSLFTKAQTVKTEPLVEDVHSLQVNAGGDWKQLPIITLNTDQFIQINFDRLGENASTTLRYRIVYCNADWTRSPLAEIEYISGFNNVLIDDYAHSVNTTVEYTNFIVNIPNERIKLKYAGNYVVEVYEDTNKSTTLLTACFSVVDPQISMTASVSSNTMIDSNKEHQQISFSINTNNLQIRDAFSDLKVYVHQNNRVDNQKSLIKPTSIQGTKLVYEYNRDLIFEAGNEYRRFEIVSHRYNGLNVESVSYFNPNYLANILPDKLKSGKNYSYDRDQNGRFVIRNAEVNDSNIGADYFVTTFRLLTTTPFIEPIYLNGGFSYGKFNDTYLMTYDANKNEYSTSILLKQGAYNYQYLAKSGNKYTTSLTEGNYFETENEYCIMVYYRPWGQRTDLLAGTLLISNK
ncbi:MAG: hypothetical protein RL662_1496 [Bacteroidota bacterium]|jgi:hypothetical protein